MIANFQELQVLLYKLDRNLNEIRKKIQNPYSKLDLKERNDLEKKEVVIREKALRYISFYKEKIAGNYLANRLYENKLTELEKHYKPNPVDTEAIIYSIEILKNKHETLNLDKGFYIKMRRFSEYTACTKSEKKIETVAEMLLEECKLKLKNSPHHSELIKRYQIVLEYFKLDFERKKNNLEMQLEMQQRKLKNLMIIFNFRKANQIREEIAETKTELIKINKIIEFRNSE